MFSPYLLFPLVIFLQSPPHTHTHTTQDRLLPQIIDVCNAEQRFIWLGILFTYKGILLIAGLFLAFETRNVKIPQLNDSKLIGMSVYGIVVLSVALAAMGILLETFVEVYYAVMGIMIMLGTTCLLCLIFIPKVCCVLSLKKGTVEPPYPAFELTGMHLLLSLTT